MLLMTEVFFSYRINFKDNGRPEKILRTKLDIWPNIMGIGVPLPLK